jgi:hypothetical protein
MRPLSTWSVKRVVIACAVWLIGAPLLAAVGLLLGGGVLSAFSGKTRVAISVSLTGWGTFPWLFAPPIILIAAWLWNRRATS